MSTYFKADENFDQIIQDNLQDKRINDITRITTGWTNIVYEVETDEGNYFFRFPRDDFWARTIIKDYEFGKYIYKKTNFNTIQLSISYDKNRPFSIHKKIEGIPLAEKMNNLTPTEIEEVSKEIADFMYQLHSMEYDNNNIFKTDNIGLKLTDFLDELLKKHVSKEDIKFWSISDNNENSCLVHGDLNSSNIILDENNHVSGIIDFGFGGFGNKYDDIARIIGRCPESFKESIIKNYEKYSNSKLNINRLNQDIDKWSNIDKSYINYMKKIGIY